MKKVISLTIMLALTTILQVSRTSAMEGAVEVTNLDVFTLNTDRTMAGKANGKGWQDPITGFNIVRTFRNSADQTVIFALNSNTGATVAYGVNPDGSIGDLMSSWPAAQKELRCGNAEFAKIGGVLKLITEDPFTGLIRTFPVNDFGTPDLNAMSQQYVADMEDKNLFSVYECQSSPYSTFTQIIGVNTWSGETAIYSLDLQKVATATWTRGWTSMDYLKIGALTYRLLYKAAGDPYKRPGENGDEARRFMIETVGTNGTSQVIQNIELGASLRDCSSVRFVQFPLVRSGSNYGVLFYRRTTATYAIYEFNPQTGLGNLIDFGQLSDGRPLPREGLPAPPYIDLTTYVMNGKTCLAFVSPDNAKPLGYDQAEKMGQVIQHTMEYYTVGYQFALAQSGRLYFIRGWGKSKLDANANQTRNMTWRTRLNIGSVSKMVTTTTLLKLAEYNELTLNDKITAHIDPTQTNSSTWAKDTAVRNLLTHTTGITEDLCTVDDSALTVDCKGFFNAPHYSAEDFHCELDANGNWNCTRSYNNSNIVAVRKVIEKVASTPNFPVKTSKDIVTKTRDLWARDADLDGMTCAVNPNAYYFGACNGAAECFLVGNTSWRQNRPWDQSKWSSYCSSGGWYASSRELIEFLGAIRYKKAIENTALTNTLLSTSLVDANGKPTALSWEPPWFSDGENVLGKSGDLTWSGVGVHAYISRLPNNCDAVIQMNSDSAASLPGLLQHAYKNGVLGETVRDRNGDYANSVSDHTTHTAINTATIGTVDSRHVVVSRGAGNSLKLRVLKASRLIDAAQVDVVAEETASIPWEVSDAASIAISEGPNFATLSLGSGRLNIITWNLNGSQLTQKAIALGPVPSETPGDVAVTKIAADGAKFRIVTSVRNSDYQRQFDVWDCDNAAATITHKSSFIDDPGSDIMDIKNLGAVGDFSKAARVVTADSVGVNILRVRTLQVDVSGSLQVKDTQYFGSLAISSDDSLVHRVAVDGAGDGASGFFNGHGFMTSFIADSHKLTVATWGVDDDAKITFKDYQQTVGGVVGQALSSTTTVVMLDDDPNTDASELWFVKSIKWSVADNGTIFRTWNDAPGFRVTDVAATGNLVASFVPYFPPQSLRVFNWAVLDPQ
jgi:hypothetical protein